MRTVWDVSTAIESYPRRFGESCFSGLTQGEVVLAIQRMLDGLVFEPRTQTVDTGTLISNFNALLQQVKEQFRGSDTLRVIEPLGYDASVALIAVRLSIVKRTVDAELARVTAEAS
jgi:hypothetical protein